eukprot:TRINITY_DN19485_c0_g1_i2.p1 TRINITY_DN19485_c0_g1~~TRINITY_DN19485_c0_g1_i2.p1  ORF type:complete len:208 (+),score=41.82 TRINITY_DN19485_c0_g1_i2:98-721(+)
MSAELTVPALLKSTRVTSVSDGAFELGFHATVLQNGHVFKGILYDAGPDTSASAKVPVASSLSLVPLPSLPESVLLSSARAAFGAGAAELPAAPPRTAMSALASAGEREWGFLGQQHPQQKIRGAPNGVNSAAGVGLYLGEGPKRPHSNGRPPSLLMLGPSLALSTGPDEGHRESEAELSDVRVASQQHDFLGLASRSDNAGQDLGL